MHDKIQMKEKFPNLYSYSIGCKEFEMEEVNKLMCCACNESFIYSKGFEVYRCDACYDKEMERKANESTVNRDM